MVSFTFDDVRKRSHHRRSVAGAIRRAGDLLCRGSLVDQWSGHWVGAGADDIVGLHRGGHELACHTFSHTRAVALDSAALAMEMESNRRYFLSLDPRSGWRISPIPTAWAHCRANDSSARLPFFPWHRSRRQQRHRRSAFLRATPLIDGQIGAEGIDRAFDEPSPPTAG